MYSNIYDEENSFLTFTNTHSQKCEWNNQLLSRSSRLDVFVFAPDAAALESSLLSHAPAQLDFLSLVSCFASALA